MFENPKEYRGWPVLVDPDRVLRDRYAGSVGRILHRNAEKGSVVIVYFQDYNKYEAYCSDELLVLLPGRTILDNLIANYPVLKMAEVRAILDVYSLFEEKYYSDAFQLAQKRENVKKFCLVSCKELSQKKQRNMKVKKDFMIGRVARVPSDLTTDPFERRGEIGRIVNTDRVNDTITMKFDDGLTADYVFNCLEILLPTKAILYGLNAKWKEFDKEERSIIKEVIRLASKKDSKAALMLACTETAVKNFCVTDTEAFYALKKNPRKHLGLR
ncbi:hypothetical protein JHJ32_07290 [Parapedobacter sp. ISTM3]|uniref:hypothetical protein n=1 Tax=Parapedobacter sp. ISTM3 TaxID=2800130 RepID=UPI001905D6C0|nr:hypothetical protein [Parapedobacter sp. ISTM3]MBK1439781.1 hypothetical protein [Parapedobacter sp. ISTM3]